MDRCRQLRRDEGTMLMRKAADGDVEAFDCLYRRFHPIVRRSFAGCVNHNISSDDLIQEVFTRLWQHRGNFRGDSAFLTYLLSIAKHVCSEKAREYRRIARLDLKEHAHFIVDSHNGLSQPEAELCLKELNAALDRIRAILTAEQRQALEISQAPDVRLPEASRKLGCSYEALRCRLKRARKRSRELLARILKDE